MKLIFVAGMADIDRATIIDLSLQRAGHKQDFAVVDFDRIDDIGEDVMAAEEFDAVRSMLSQFYEKTEKAMIAELKQQNAGIVVSGCLTFPTRYGYTRAANEEFFRSFKPDIIVILERYAGAGKKIDAATTDHQRINRYYGTIYSSMCGSSLKLIKFRENRMMEAVAELAEVIKH